MGQNIGTCVTALISCIGAKKNAKRAALVHLYFNIIGTLVICALFYGSNLIFQYGFLDDVVAEANIAVIHTAFNIAATAMLLPFTRQLEKLACLTIKDTEEESEAPFLDERFLNTPSLATDRALNVTEKWQDFRRVHFSAHLKWLVIITKKRLTHFLKTKTQLICTKM